MSLRSETRWVSAFFVGVAGVLAAGDVRGQEAFGIGPQVTIVYGNEFNGKLFANSPDLLGDNNTLYFGDPTNAGGRYHAGLHLPAGAVLTDITCFVNDTNPSDDIRIGLHREVHDVFSNLPGSYSEAYMTSQGSSGYQRPSSGPLNHTVRYQDGTLYQIYYLFVDVRPATSLRECRLTWHRSVSPAPATATFGDVPTNFAYFRAIEALAAAGVTSGCGNGNFCPNQNLTRGEFAAFLARALGMHWPQ